MRGKPYNVTVLETNTIAGEVVTGRVVVKWFKLLTDAQDWCYQQWRGNPPSSARFGHKDGTDYGKVPSKV